MNLDKWMESLEPIKYTDLPSHKAIISVDMVNGFTHLGPLASPRVKSIVPAIQNLVNGAKDNGCKLFVSIQDTHDEKAVEFQSYPPHCVEGSEEANLIPELEAIGVSWKGFRKNSINPGAKMAYGLNAQLLGWTEKRNPSSGWNIETFIVVGNCTDLCVYATAMYIKCFFNEIQVDRIKVVVPENCVQTYDLPDIHDGDFFHKTFLYHMAQNGILVPSRIEF